MAELTKVRCVLAVRNLDASVNYYTRVLGMATDFTAPGWAFLSRGSFRLMLGECADAMPAHETGDHSYFVYVTVEGIDEFYGELVGNGATLTRTLADKPWGMREFGVRTPDGHRIMFGQEL
ncbi:MAG TPA: VOC family protein [Pyrinomonadaceae bacterium]|nr:VOC family protein [Pyrinomonadaceae bacterium]